MSCLNSSGWFLARGSHAVCSDGWSHMKVRCPRWLLHSPSGTSLWMLGTARDGWASLCLCSFSTARRSRVFRLLTWHLTSSQSKLSKSTRQANEFLVTQLLKSYCVPFAVFHWLPRDSSDSHGRGLHKGRSIWGVVHCGGRHFWRLSTVRNMTAK